MPRPLWILALVALAGCAGTIDGSEARAHEQIPMRPHVVVISADNRAILKHGRFLKVDAGTGKSDRRELTAFQQKANEIAGVVTDHSDDFTRAANAGGIAVC